MGFQKGHKVHGGFQAGKKHPNWKGGIKISHGYILVLCPNHPSANNIGYVREHRLIMEYYLKRFLSLKEQVHHINRNKKDNRIQNLMLFTSNSAHKRFEGGGAFNPLEIVFDGRPVVCK